MYLVKKRRSIRKYKSDPVSDEDLKAMLEAARRAPSWSNRQCWQYIIVEDQRIKNELAEAGEKWVAEAPMIVVVCADPEASGHKPGMDYFMLDVGISFEHLILAATNLGLGTCWIGGFDEKIVKEALEVPDEIRVVAFTPVGYPDETKGEVFNRKSLGEICFYERYGQTKHRNLKGAVSRKIEKLKIGSRKLDEKVRNLVDRSVSRGGG
jgi:nitroreductase